ncbi:MAG: hypothetical protein AAFV93_10885 [Chloroflexota bacterium]
MAKSIAQKLLIKSGYTVRFINAPDDYESQIGELPDNVTLTDSDSADVVQLFVSNISDLEQYVSTAINVLKENGILWISYPKKSSKVETDISRDVGWDVMDTHDYRPVMQVSIDDTWSALRWRPKDQVGK